MKIKRGSTSVRRLVFIASSLGTTGTGLANLVFNSAGLVAYYYASDLNNELQITLATATLGTYTSGGFIAVDNTNMPGWYEIGIPNAALDGGDIVAIHLRGATNMVPANLVIELDAIDYQVAVASQTSVDTIDDFLDSEIAAIKAKTDAMTFTATSYLQVDARYWDGIGIHPSGTDGVPIVNLGYIEGVPVNPQVGTAFVTMFNVASPVFTVASVNQTGDSYARIGANGANLSTLATAANLATVASYLDTEIGTIITAVGTTIQNQISALNNLTAAQIAAGLLDLTDGIETNWTVRQGLRIFLSALAGKVSGAEDTPIIFRDVNDTKNRIVATVDSSGNRTAITRDAT